MDDLRTGRAARAVVGITGATAVLWLVYAARTALFPFCVAFVFAYLLDPLIDKLEKFRINRSIAIIFLLTTLFVLFLGAAILLAPMIWDQVENLGKNLPVYIDKLEKNIAPLAQSISDIDPQQVQAQIKETMKTLGDIPIRALRALLSGVWSGLAGAMGLVVALFNLVVIPVATFYLLKDFDTITAAVSKRIPHPHKDRTLEIIGKIDAVLSGFFRGQLIVALFMAVILSSGLFIIGVPMGLFIGIVAGLSNIVPYLPVFIGLAPALLMSYLNFGDFAHLAMVLGLFGVAQAIEGLIISPRVLEKAVGLHPVAVMASLLVGGGFFGFIGVLLAVPAAATAKVILAEMDSVYLNSEFYNGPGEKGDTP